MKKQERLLGKMLTNLVLKGISQVVEDAIPAFGHCAHCCYLIYPTTSSLSFWNGIDVWSGNITNYHFLLTNHNFNKISSTQDILGHDSKWGPQFKCEPQGPWAREYKIRNRSCTFLTSHHIFIYETALYGTQNNVWTLNNHWLILLYYTFWQRRLKR